MFVCTRRIRKGGGGQIYEFFNGNENIHIGKENLHIHTYMVHMHTHVLTYTYTAAYVSVKNNKRNEHRFKIALRPLCSRQRRRLLHSLYPSHSHTA